MYKYNKTFTFSITFNEKHAFIGLVLLFHAVMLATHFSYKLAPGNFMATAKEKAFGEEEEQKIAVRLASRLTNNTRVSRFFRYAKGVKDIKTSDDLLESLGLGDQAGLESGDDALSKLSQSEINELFEQQQKLYQEDVKGVRKILEKNRAIYQACYEKALLKDQLLNGVGKLTIFINSGNVVKVQSLFKGDGHKGAVSSLTDCLDSKSKRLNISKIKGHHKVKFNLMFKS